MIIFGSQCFKYVLANSPKQIQEVYLSKEIDESLIKEIRKNYIKIIRVDNKKAQSLSRGGNHQGIIAKIDDINTADIKSVLGLDSILVLCGLTDVGNIGSIVRTCRCLNIGAVILCDREYLKINAIEGIFRASSGALLTLPFCTMESSLEVANQLKNQEFCLIGAGMQRDAWHVNKSLNNTKKWALFIGREDIGLKQKILKKLDKIIHIEMNNFDSLNASVATGILIDRIQQQRF
ncbi:23S rRNA (guanosine(2251)-2'-O)-methyltransferase RlmB [Helicobacter muridarum]|uniref:23S rRNA (Guanosine(2251)-2'-O)-methyltransferase RlmB n=1 Tax=Helicobacter muridarum TaxID=216 RepID=A0A099TZH1_9HELI|nr:23S rRNA (guanosine(2251)-2'-O)-methyltransferase RlmB [Helicobacter muridarum]TLD99771.1 23S rRNA (guanosine(2251)-2'-O)-methyltransferase RlmB [Helicobacter muridarum]STQ86995.1 23S rRNA methyltransferase [Helicobacter muridarum]